MAATKKNGKEKSGGGSGSSSKGSASKSKSTKKKSNGKPSPQSTTTPKTNGKKKTTKRRRKNNGIGGKLNFKGVSRAFKGTVVGTGGAFGSRVAADLGLGVAINIAPRVALLQHPYARPVVTFFIGLLGIGHGAAALGMSQESQATARVGGMIAGGLDALEVLVPDARGAITGRFKAIASRVRNAGGGIDSRAVATTDRTAISSVANGAAAGAVQQALDAGMTPQAASVIGQRAAAGAMAGLGELQGGSNDGDDDDELGDLDDGDDEENY